MNSYRWAAVLGLPAGVALLTEADRWLEVARQSAGRTFIFAPLFGVMSLVNLLYAAVLLALLWALIRARSHANNGLYLVVGLLLLFYMPLRFLVISNLPPALRDAIPTSTVILTPVRGWNLLGAFVTLMPVWAWLKNCRARQSVAAVEPAPATR